MAHVLVMGASCGIGLETVKPGLRAGHSVRALARSAASIAIQDAALENVSGDALDSDMIRDALQGIDAAIQTLGIDISPPTPRGAIFEHTTLFSKCTRILVDGMKAAGVKRLLGDRPVSALAPGLTRRSRAVGSEPRCPWMPGSSPGMTSLL